MLNGLRDHDSGRSKDPAEDVFVSNVWTAQGQYRIINGIFPASDFSLQRLLDAISAQDFPEQIAIMSAVNALLVLSDTVAERAGLQRNAYVAGQHGRTQWTFAPSNLLALGRATRFSSSDLRTIGIDPDVLKPFCSTAAHGLLASEDGRAVPNGTLLLQDEDGVNLTIPTLVSPVLRLYLTQLIEDQVIPKGAVDALQENQLGRWIAVDMFPRGIKPVRADHLGFEPADATGVLESIIQ